MYCYCAAISGVVLTPDPQDDSRNVVFSVDTPAAGDDQLLCVLQEPIAAGECGLAMLCGATVVNLNGDDVDGTAGVTAGQTYLTPGNGGAANILWSAGGGGLQLALVRMPLGSPASSTPVAQVMLTSLAITTPMVWPTTIDGITEFDPVLIATCSGAGQMPVGVYSAGGAANDGSRPWTYLGRPAFCPVTEGTSYGKTLWCLNTYATSGYYQQYNVTNFPSGGATTGDVLTAQADGTVAFQAPTGGGGGGFSPDMVTLDSGGAGSTAEIKPGGVGTAQVADAAVTAAKLSSATATAGQVATADGAGGVTYANATGSAPDGVTLDLTTDTPPKLEIKAQGVDSAQIKAGAVSESELADDAVTTDKIADAAVATAKIEDAAVTTAKLAAGVVPAPDGVTLDLTSDTPPKLEIKAQGVDSAQIKANAVGESEIADGAVTTDKIADGAVGPAELADSVVDGETVVKDATTQALKIANHGVTAVQLADGAVGADALAAGGVGTAALADGGVTATKLAAGVVPDPDDITLGLTTDTPPKLQVKESGITSTQIAAGAVGADELAANAVGPAALGAVTDEATITRDASSKLKVKDGGIGGTQLADGAVDTDQIADGAVGTDELANGAVSAAKIASGALSSHPATVTAVGSGTFTVSLYDNGFGAAATATGVTVTLLSGAMPSVSAQIVVFSDQNGMPDYYYQGAASGTGVTTVVAAGTALATPMDGVTVATGQAVLLTNAYSGCNAGVYTYTGTGWTFVSSPGVVFVGPGGTNNGNLPFSLSGGAYSPVGYAWG